MKSQPSLITFSTSLKEHNVEKKNNYVSLKYYCRNIVAGIGGSVPFI